jgi:hypothetical protein
MITPNSILDFENQILTAPNQGTWEDLEQRTWADWRTWAENPEPVLLHLVDVIDLEQAQAFVLDIRATAQGICTYRIYTSNTGEFDGEETETVIAPGASNISVFTARYIIVGVEVTGIISAPVLERLTVKVSREPQVVYLNNIDTSTLPGTVTERTLPLDQYSVAGIQATARAITAYTLDLYVSSTNTSTILMPEITNAAEHKIRLRGLDNQPRDGVVDVIAEVLPKMTRRGNDLILQ